MSYSFNINSYKGNSASIINRIRPLRAYEVNLNKILVDEMHSEHAVSFRRGIRCLDVLLDNHALGDWGFYDSDSLFFYNISPDFMSGKNVYTEDENYYGIFFEPEPILNVIRSLLSSSDDIQEFYPTQYMIEDYQIEKEAFSKLLKLLENSISSSSIIGCKWC